MIYLRYKTDEISIKLPGIDFVEISNIGYVEGKWQTTFKIESVDESKKIARDIELGDMLAAVC